MQCEGIKRGIAATGPHPVSVPQRQILENEPASPQGIITDTNSTKNKYDGGKRRGTNVYQSKRIHGKGVWDGMEKAVARHSLSLPGNATFIM